MIMLVAVRIKGLVRLVLINLVTICKRFVLEFRKKHVRRLCEIFFAFSSSVLFIFFKFYLATSITFLHKEQTLLVTITGRPEHVRVAQVQLLREIQRPMKMKVSIPLEFHRYIIGTRGATLKQLEQETLTTIKVPQQDSQSDEIIVEGAKDNVKVCQEKILQLYRTQSNKGFERLSIPCLYHPWIRHQLVDQLQQKYNVTINLPPLMKQADEISIRGEREPVEQAKIKIMEFYKSLVSKLSKKKTNLERTFDDEHFV